MSNGERSLRVMSFVSVACTIAMTLSIGGRALFEPRESGKARVRRAPEEVKNWAALSDVGHRIGSPTAEIVVLEFGDYQCPFCRRFEQNVFSVVQKQFPNNVALVYRHWPLPNHAHSYAAARAAECAGDQDKFSDMHSLLFQMQDSIGVKPFVGFAEAASVPDIVRFKRCVEATGTHTTIEADVAAAKALGATGTPTILVDGLRFFGTPDTTTLIRLVRERLEAKRRKRG